jgi:hypothetical protein
MTTPPDHDVRRLERLGDTLEAAARTDLGRPRSAAWHPRAGALRGRRALLAAAAAALVAAPGVAIATNALVGEDDVARSIPNGTLALLDTHPHCTTVRVNVEFDCVLRSPPRDPKRLPASWKGTVESTVNAAEQIDGGCRALDDDGTHWRCYVGQEAVRRQIIGPDLLGQPSAGPGVG